MKTHDKGMELYSKLKEIHSSILLQKWFRMIPNNGTHRFFRSIDSESVEGFPMNIRGAEEQNLEWTRNVAIDKSINMAHIQTIRPAEHFIYIENKYFIEHVATIEDWFENIENMVCLSYVNRMAEDNWKRYTNKPFTPLQGHILKYPAHWRLTLMVM